MKAGCPKHEDVSVVIPVHNEEKTLNHCLTSVRRQKRVWEIIIVLDRCEDGSQSIAEKHMAKDERIRTITMKAHNFKTNYRAEAMNLGISKAKSDVILIVDADTVLWRNYISLLIPHLQKSVVSVTGRLIPVSKRFQQFFETIGGTGRIFLFSVWKETDGFQDVMSCDTFFDLELLKRGYDFKVVDEAVMYDIRDYSMKQLTRQALRRGRGRRQIGQSFLFMLAHGLYCLTRTPFGLIELLANTAGYLTTQRKTPREYMKRYEARRIHEIIRKLVRVVDIRRMHMKL